MTCDLGVVLEIAGGLSATALAFIVCPTSLFFRFEADVMIVPRICVFRFDKGTMVFPSEVTCGDLYCIWNYCINVKLWIDA